MTPKSIPTIEYNSSTLPYMIIGTAQFGMDYSLDSNQQPNRQIPLSDAHHILTTALSYGVNMVDTASAYGSSEACIGQFIKHHSDKKLHIMTKISSQLFNTPLQTFITTIKETLDRLQVDSISILLLHDSTTAIKPTYIDRLKSLALIKHFGISIYTEEEFYMALKEPLIEIIQLPYNLFDTRALKWSELSYKHHKQLLLRSVYLQGLLFTHHYYQDPSIHLYFDKIAYYCDTLKWNRHYFLLAFVMATMPHIPIIMGQMDNQQLQINIESINALLHHNPLNDDTWQREILNDFAHVPQSLYNPTLW